MCLFDFQRQFTLKPGWLEFGTADNRQLRCYKASTKLTGAMRCDNSQHDTLSVQGNTYVCGRGIAGLTVTGCVWTNGYTVRSNMLDSTVSSIFAMLKVARCKPTNVF